MASLFLSYDRDDSDRARHFAIALEKAGHQVWWDLHVRGGAQFSKVIEEALKAADVVVVLWSKYAVESAWVRDEAATGRDSGRLVPVTIDRTEPPLGFRQFQTIDLSQWKGRGRSPQFASLLADIDAISAEPVELDPAKVSRKPEPADPRWQTPFIYLLIGLAALILAGGVYLWRPFAHTEGAVIAVQPGDATLASLALAHDLTIKLGSLDAAHSGSMRLISEGGVSNEHPDLILQTASAASAHGVGASVLLMSGKDRSILWSKDLDQPSASVADLKQQIAFASARVLNCSLEGLQSRPSLKPGILKAYLNACAELGGGSGVDPETVHQMLVTVTSAAPTFVPAWRKLLLSEAGGINIPVINGETQDASAVDRLRQHIREAEKVAPGMSEALIAEAELLPPRSFTAKMALIERAARQSPDDPAVLRYYSQALRAVGNDFRAAEHARRAAEIDPLSPLSLGLYIQTLAYTGQFDAAQRELSEAERMWPGTAMLDDAKFRYNYRYGDPKVALAMPGADSSGGLARDFLETRINPSPARTRALLAEIDALLARANNPSGGLGFVVLARGAFGRSEELFPLLLNWPKADDLAVGAEIFFRPELAQFRRDPRFMQVAKRMGLVDYWKKSGNWPDFCAEPNIPYDCKKEAAKLGA